MTCFLLVIAVQKYRKFGDRIPRLRAAVQLTSIGRVVLLFPLSVLQLLPVKLFPPLITQDQQPTGLL
jgi:hypothetical protein